MTTIAIWLLGTAGGIASAWALSRLVNRLIHRWHNSHPGLFCGLCRLHRLDRNSRRLLKQVTQFHRLAQPGRIFTEPQWLDPDRLGAAWRVRASELHALRARLFDLDPVSGG